MLDVSVKFAMIEKTKVLTYITRGSRLLVFTHPTAPEAGIQVPGGTVEPDELVEDAALREAIEETGLAGLRLSAFLGQHSRDMSDFGIPEIHHRYYFHIWCDEDAPEYWQHGEYMSADEPIPFDFYWVEMPDDLPDIIADHSIYLPTLAANLGLA
ncbi:MAG: NUDIX domain-containing protein [Chloroflexi bacterium]|nr:NUDIX domain-containing protein [Chloroflexota bacterium]